MAVRNTREVWGWPARAIHWLMALAIIGTWFLGKQMVDIPDAEMMRKFDLYQLHKSIGFTLFAAAILRLVWRAVNPTPALPERMPAWQRQAAHVSHALLYLALLGIPLTGWLMVSTSQFQIPTMVFGVLHVPHLMGPDAALEGTFKALHEILGNVLAGLVVLHILAALKHVVLDDDDVLGRMTLGRARAPLAGDAAVRGASEAG